MIFEIPERQDEMAAPPDEAMTQPWPREYECTRHALALCLDAELAEFEALIGTAYNGARR